MTDSVALADLHQPFPPVLPAREIEAKANASVLVPRAKNRPANDARSQTKLIKPPVASEPVEEPVAVQKTFFDEAGKLELEIQDLRSQLSTKPFEQNAQLCRMLARYNDEESE